MNKLLIVKKSLALSMTMMLTFGILLMIVGSAMAQEERGAPGRNAPTAPSQQQGPTDRAELEAFLDELLGSQMEEHHIAGAAVSVVKDGKLFFAKGYGYADLEKRIRVNPEQTVFRIGSNGKVFTWTAVMQLVEQGKLDLDADVNTYLDFRIPDTYPQPITLKHLMTHTSGFEDRLLGSVVSDANDLVPVREWLISHMPARVHPPGDCAGYANYNAALAGYIVARVSGQPYDQYIQEHILDPLGMAHSTAQSPIPPDLRAQASVGYTYEDGAFQVFPDYIGQPAGLPSGAHQASVTDMARFMIAHLQGGRYSDASIAEARILEESTAKQMQTTLYTADQRLLGTAYGFFDVSDNGQRTLGHSGYSPPMHSLLLLLPDQNLGVFVVYNSAGGDEPTLQHSGFQRAFFDHYYSAPAVAPIRPPADFVERAGRFVGSYRVCSSPSTTFIKVAELFGAYKVEISDPGDGTLLSTIEGREFRFAEVEPLYFRQVDGPFSVVFREDDRGHIMRMSTGVMPQYTAVKLGWYETTGFNVALALGCVLVFLSVIPVALIRFVRNRRLGSDRKPSPRGPRVAQWIIVGISVLNLLFVVGVVGVMQWGMTSELHAVSLTTKIVLGLGVLGAVLTVGALVYTVLAWKNSYWGIAARVHYTLVTVAAVAFVWFLNYWNLLGWRF
ncbi:MAG TPA: serine hydrolase domain-containing protein [Anaerolineae bacterium]|jgi:CubicO group peptidase (beta-lactamase class C family)|nr:serine hydrolase domain-containing protein [Anaerolineae bacterium]